MQDCRAKSRRWIVTATIVFAMTACTMADAAIDFHVQYPGTPAHCIAVPNLDKDARPLANAYVRCEAPIFDFGSFRSSRDKLLWCVFKVENISNRAVQIEAVQACSCTNSAGRTWLNPGQSIFVSVTLSVVHPGPVSKTVSIKVLRVGPAVRGRSPRLSVRTPGK